MTTLLQIAQLGHPILRKKAKSVNNPLHKDIQHLIDSLIATVTDVNGVGIAAPQVYESVRIFVVASHPNPRYPHVPYMKPTPMINPQILSYGNETNKDWEGCLSIPGIRGLVSRHTKITISYYDRFGKKHKRNFTEFVARIVQHEYDHLDGIVFLDRLTSVKDIVTDKEYLKIIAHQNIT
jgi:peptide deformylase